MKISRSKASLFVTASMMSVVALLATAPSASALTKERSSIQLVTEPIVYSTFLSLPGHVPVCPEEGCRPSPSMTRGISSASSSTQRHLPVQREWRDDHLQQRRDAHGVPQPDGTDL